MLRLILVFVGRKSTLLDFLWWGSIFILVRVQLKPKLGPNITQYVRTLLFIHIFTYIAISVIFLPFPHNTIMPATIQSDIWYRPFSVYKKRRLAKFLKNY